MEKGKKSKNLKEKVLFLMCLGALAGNMSTEVCAQDSVVNYDKFYKINGENKIKDEIIISDDGEEKEYGFIIKNEVKSFEEDIEIKKNNSGSSVYVEAKENNSGIAEFKKNLIITNKLGYALYAKAGAYSNATATASIIINKNKENTVQIMGNIKAESEASPDSSHYANADSKITLNLTNSNSFFAGKIETVEKKQYTGKTTTVVDINLEKGATWYAQISNESDTYTINGSDEKLKTFITSDGGVIDIYNAIPNKNQIEYFTESLKEELNSLERGLDEVSKLDKFTEEVYLELEQKLPEENMEELREMVNTLPEAKILEVVKEYLTNFVKKEINIKKEEIINIQEKEKIGERTFTLNGVGDRLQNTTFRISTDVENKKADKIVLNGVEVKKDSETYFIEIAADPFKSG